MDDRDSGPDWAKQIGVPDETPKVRVNVTQGCLYRELGIYGNRVPNEFLCAAEDRLIEKHTYDELKCQLPDSPRSTFLMVFSPDGKKVASTHGNHNVYVTDLVTGKNIQTLSGHPRTPWCIAFHPSSNQILASGCLAGQVRVWDLHGGSEVWTADSQSVIASLAFHPVDRMLVIATYNELHFWDWSHPKPFAKCSTKSEKEKVRYVTFDRLGTKLITGIANPVNAPPQWERVSVVSTQPSVTTSATATTTTAPSTTAVATTSSQSQSRAATLCENYLLNQYSQLVRRYLDLSRNRITQTMDRGTDPMDLMDGHRSRSQGDHPRHGPMPSSSHANGSRSIRYRIMRSTCRSYRPPSSRERFRIHSSLLSGLPSRSSSSSNSLVRTTTTTTTTSQSIIFTTIATSSSSSSMPQQLSRLRQCGIGFIARPVCLTISRENSASGSPSARSSQSAQSSQSGAVTNPTYTPYSDRSISSSRESNAGDSERSRFPLIRPYRILFDDINQIRASVHSLIRPLSEENGNRTSSEQRPDVISPLDRRDRLRSQFLDVEEVEIDRDMSRSLTYVSPFRRLSSDSESTSTTPTNPQRPSPQHWVSYNSNHLPLYPRPVPRFQVRPTFDMNNTSPVRRFRDNTDSDSSTNTTPAPVDTPSSTPTTSTSPSPVQLNAGPVPRLQIRPRYLQDQSQLTPQSDNQSSGLQSNPILRRQFVLSRHSNSPFQPRVPHVVQNSGPGTTAASSTSTSAAAASVITTANRQNSTPSGSASTSTSAGSGSSAASVISTAASSTSTVASVICTATGPTSSAASVISTVASSTSTAASVICTVAPPNSTAAAASVITTAARSSSAAVSSTSSSDEDNTISTAGRSTSATASVITTAARSSANASSSTSAVASVITTAARSASTSANSTSAAASVITTAARSASTSANSTSAAASVITTAARSASTAASGTSTAASVISTAARPNSTSFATSVISTAARSTSASAGRSSATASVIAIATRSTHGPRSSSATRSTTTPVRRTSTAARSSTIPVPEIPPDLIGFVASLESVGVTYPTPTTSSRATDTVTTATSEDDVFMRLSRQLRSRLNFLEYVQMLIRDRLRDFPEQPPVENTLDYSSIVDEMERNTYNPMISSLEDENMVSLIHPIVMDSLLASVSRMNDNTSGTPLFPSTSSTSSGRPSMGMIPSTSSSAELDLEISQPSRGNASNETHQSGDSVDEPNNSDDRALSERIRMMGNEVVAMQRMCRARIEVVQIQHINKLWQELTQQIKDLHHIVQNRNTVRPVYCPQDQIHPPFNPMERLSFNLSTPVPGPSTPQRPSRPVIPTGQSPSSDQPPSSSDLVGNALESMLYAIFNDEDLSDDETETAPRMRTRRATRQQASEIDEPQPGPSGLNRSSHSRRDDIQTRLYRSIKEAMKRYKKKRNAAAAATATGAAGQSTSQRQDDRGRPPRAVRNSQDTSILRDFPDMGSNLDFVINELENRTPEVDPNARPPEPQPGTSRNCQSCNQRKKLERNVTRQQPTRQQPTRQQPARQQPARQQTTSQQTTRQQSTSQPTTRQQKRKTTESASASQPGVSAPKIARTNAERRAILTSCRSVPNRRAPVGFFEMPGPRPSSGREMLRRLIQRMELMLRFQREAYRRAELGISDPCAGHLHFSDDSDSDGTPSTQDSRNLPNDCPISRTDMVNLGRAITQLRARRFIEYLLQNLTEFFEHTRDVESPVNNQVINLYTLMHLSLELTDMFLEQLTASSNDLEGIWGLRPVRARPFEVPNNEIFFPEQARALRRLRERARAPHRFCIHTSTAREEGRRYQNPFVRTPRPRLSTNQTPSRMGHHSSSPGFCRYRPSSTFSPSFRRFRRVSPRTSGGLPSGWWSFSDSPRRASQVPRSREGHTSVIVSNIIRNPENPSQSQITGVRIWERRNSVDGESDFHLRSDTNNNSNQNLGSASGRILAVDTTHENGPIGSVIASTSGNPSNANSLSFSAYLNLREQRPMFWIRYGNTNEPAGAADSHSREGNFTVPVVHVNDIPVQDVSMLNQPRYRPQSPTPRGPEEMWRWRAWRPRFLHPRYSGPHTYDDQDANDVPEGVHYYRIVNTASGSNPGLYSLDPVIITDAPMSPHHRIQAWDFSKMKIPDISDREANGVVAECKIHNDASVDVSNDGHLLVTLLPSGRFSVTTMLGVYSLDWSTLGQLLYKTSFEQNAVSVSLSPTNRHLLVGLASRPLVLREHVNMAQIFRMEGARPTPPGGTWQSGRGRLVHLRDLEQTRESSIMSLNCIRWAPGAGQGLVYGTNTGQLRVLR